jgi:hypothetical protein
MSATVAALFAVGGDSLISGMDLDFTPQVAGLIAAAVGLAAGVAVGLAARWRGGRRVGWAAGLGPVTLGLLVGALWFTETAPLPPAVRRALSNRDNPVGQPSGEFRALDPDVMKGK